MQGTKAVNNPRGDCTRVVITIARIKSYIHISIRKSEIAGVSLAYGLPFAEFRLGSLYDDLVHAPNVSLQDAFLLVSRDLTILVVAG